MKRLSIDGSFIVKIKKSQNKRKQQHRKRQTNPIFLWLDKGAYLQVDWSLQINIEQALVRNEVHPITISPCSFCIVSMLIPNACSCVKYVTEIDIHYLDHPLLFFPSFSTGNTTGWPICPFSDHAVNRGCLWMILVMIDAHVCFVHSIEATKIIIKLIWKVIVSTS